MRILEKLMMGFALTGLLFALSGCCCLGGSETGVNDDTDIVLPGPPHDQGGGGA